MQPSHPTATSPALPEHYQNIQRLRRAVFESAEPAESPLFNELLAAEAAPPVAELLPAPAAGSVLWQTTPPISHSQRGTPMGPQSTGLTVTARLRMAHVPTSIVHLLDAAQHPLVSLHVHNGRNSIARLRLSAFVEGYSAHAIETVEIAPQKEAETLLLPTFFPERLASFTEVCRASLHIQIDDLDAKVEQQRTFPIWMLARTSALLHVPDPATGLPRDLTPYLGVWVTPNVPPVFDLLRKAAANISGGSVVSYQGDAHAVEAQVKAIYEALKGAGVTYVNSVLSFGAVPGVLAQRIRLPRESLAQRSANCIDGTMLMASILEAASLHPAIVLVPGHAFLAWEVPYGSNMWDYLETTMLGAHSFARAQIEGRRLSEKYIELAKLQPTAFCRLPLRQLRSQGIWPME